jgi:hypothetical protein
MISRRFFSRLPAAAAVSAAVAAAAETDRELRQDIRGPWNTLMTFSAPPPAPLPASFYIMETFLPQGDYISMAALPFTTSAHGAWEATDGQIKTRSRLIVLPQVLGVAVKVEITEVITLDWSRFSYTGTFEATFTPETGQAFTLKGIPTGSRIPPA